MMRDRVDVVWHITRRTCNGCTILAKIDHLYLYCKHQEHCTNTLPTDHRGAKIIVQHLPNEGREAHIIFLI